ncbi:hypothetical protein FA95DRAFT_690906 [Auriscalpium vulgare]|uniref:Uncharacterized protein n=1 Tax=Auriscalpium vulgare TaxID=40419 RepID=A0ACB8RC38_9AGAM|nr:hypothetical protein FA95DRAFT_690906 [Auriscalpium vulgare]
MFASVQRTSSPDLLTTQDPRAPPASHASRSRFADAQPAPPLPLKASGPNSVPIGARKGPSPGAVSQHSPVERLNRREPFNGGGDAVSGRRGRDYVDDEPSRSAPVPSQRVPSRASPDNARAPPRRERPAQPPHSDSFAPQAPTAPRRESFTTSERVSRFGPPIQRPSEDSVQDNRRWPARPLTPPPPRHTTPPPPPSRAYALDDTERYTDRRLSSVRAERSTGLVEDVSRLRVAHDDDRLDRRAPPRRNDSPGRRSDYSYDRPSVEDARAERNRHSPPVQRDREPPRRKETSPYARTQPLPEPRRPASWDRPPTPDSARLPPRPADHVPNHVESRNVSPPPATVHEPAPTARTSKPVRIRRPPAEAYSREMPPPPAKEGHAILERIEKRPEPVHALPERVPLRRAPSLLDRLSSDKPSGQGPSLRERVDDWDMDTGGGARYSRDDDESNGDGGRGRSKKRGRPKRGSIQVVILDRLAVDVGHQRDRHQGERADE